MSNRRFIVPGAVVLGVVGLSIAVQYGRGLGPTGRAAGGASGCVSAEGLEEARKLVENPETIERKMVETVGQPRIEADWSTATDLYLVKLEAYVGDPEVGEVPDFDVIREMDVQDRVQDPEIKRVFEEMKIVPKELLVQAHPDLGDRDPSLGLDDIIIVQSDQPVDVLVGKVGGLKGVEWIEPVMELRAMASAPDDPAHPLQWSFQVLDVPSAWDRMVDKFGEPTTIAVVDTGVTAGLDSYDHLVTGRDVVNRDDDPKDEHGHGSAMASLLASASDNGIGIAGISPGAHVMPIRALNESAIGSTIDTSAGMLWAIDNGADILVLPFGMYDESLLMAEILDYAEAMNVLVVASAGNDGLTEQIAFPARYPTVVSVGAVDVNGEPTIYSNYSIDLDVYAPGGDMSVDLDGDQVADGILVDSSIKDGNGFVLWEGTSLAATHVAGIAGIARELGYTDVQDLRSALRTSMTPVNPRTQLDPSGKTPSKPGGGDSAGGFEPGLLDVGKLLDGIPKPGEISVDRFESDPYRRAHKGLKPKKPGADGGMIIDRVEADWPGDDMDMDIDREPAKAPSSADMEIDRDPATPRAEPPIAPLDRSPLAPQKPRKLVIDREAAPILMDLSVRPLLQEGLFEISWITPLPSDTSCTIDEEDGPKMGSLVQSPWHRVVAKLHADMPTDFTCRSSTAYKTVSAEYTFFPEGLKVPGDFNRCENVDAGTVCLVEVPERAPCPDLNRDACYDSDQCVVVKLDDSEHMYACRAAQNACEDGFVQAMGSADCPLTRGCVYDPGQCYCPEGVTCVCGGGEPATCEPLRDVSTRAPALRPGR